MPMLVVRLMEIFATHWQIVIHTVATTIVRAARVVPFPIAIQVAIYLIRNVSIQQPHHSIVKGQQLPAMGMLAMY